MRGILLSLCGDTIRVALEDCGDAAEYRRVDSGWVTEYGEPVEIELQRMPTSEPVCLPVTSDTERPTGVSCVV